MRKLMSSLGRGVLALSLSVGLALPLASVPAAAAPFATVAPADSSVVLAGHRHHMRERHYHDDYRWRRHHRDYDDYGWRHRRHRNDGLALGLAIGVPLLYGLSQSRPVVRYVEPRGYGNAHVRWCYNRYRSYRAWDNTFQPYGGPRQQCYSPYD